MNPTELKAITFSKLITRGVPVKMNHRVRLSSIRGYQQVSLDLAALDAEGKPVLAGYIGPRKERKLIKYRSARVPFLELADEEDLARFVVQFIEKYTEITYK